MRIAYVDGNFYSFVAGRILKDSTQNAQRRTDAPKPKKHPGKTQRDKFQKWVKGKIKAKGVWK